MNDIVASLSDAMDDRDYDALESQWLDLLGVDSLPADDLADLLDRLVERDQGPRALDLVLALAPDLVKSGRHAEALPLLRAAAPVAGSNEEVRNLLIECYRSVYGDLTHLDACIEAAKLLTSASLAAAIAVLDRMLSSKVGDYFYHPSGWGTGPIVDFDILTAAATIDFEHKPGHIVPLLTLEEIFTRLDPEDFRVLRRTDPDRLRQLTQDEPTAFIAMVLKANGGRIGQRALREMVAPAFLPAAEWSRWWTRARSAITRDPHIETSKGSNPVLRLREEALTYEAEMHARLARMRDITTKTRLLRDYVAHMARGADPEAFLVPAARALAEGIAQAKPGPAFEAAALLSRLHVDAGPHPTPAQIIEQQEDPFFLLRSLKTTDARRLAFDLLQERTGAPEAICFRTLIEGPRELWDAAIAKLPRTGEGPSVAALVQHALASPKANLELFAWVCRNLLSDRWGITVGTSHLFDLLLTAGDEVARRKADEFVAGTGKDDQALDDIRLTIRFDNMDYFDDLAGSISGAEAGRLLFRVRQSSVLSAQMARILENKLVRHHPRLLADERQEAAGPQFIYCTQSGINRRRDQYEHLVNDLIPENAKDIGRAAALGDISDNADWRAAIQERDRLSALRGQMTDELQRARPIEPNMVSTDNVSIGSRVTVENLDTGQQDVYTLLGPWDSDPESNTISYTAPLAQALLRQKAGAETVFEHAGQKTRYKVLTIEDSFQPPA